MDRAECPGRILREQPAPVPNLSAQGWCAPRLGSQPPRSPSGAPANLAHTHYGQACNLRQARRAPPRKGSSTARAFSSFRNELPESASSPSVSSQQVDEKLSKKTLTVP